MVRHSPFYQAMRDGTNMFEAYDFEKDGSAVSKYPGDLRAFSRTDSSSTFWIFRVPEWCVAVESFECTDVTLAGTAMERTALQLPDAWDL